MLELVRFLGEAHQVATNQDVECWQLAVDVEELYRQGFSVIDIRKCLLKKYCKLRVETTQFDATLRAFESVNSLTVPARSCAVITPLGLEYLNLQAPSVNGSICDHPKPTWDCGQRSLFYKGELIKRFRCQARNQEIILSVFEEEFWAKRIDDPLRSENELERKQRLHDTIRGLNRNRKSKILKFTGDGKGLGIIWEGE